MRNFLRIPSNQLSITLFAILLLSLLKTSQLEHLYPFLVALFSSIIFDMLFCKLRNKLLFFPSASLVTGSIIGLLVSPNLPMYQIMIISFLAVLSKHFVTLSQRHIFNPAAFGLVLGGFFFRDALSWWGASWQQFSIGHLPSMISFFILLSPALVSLYRMKRYRIFLSFLFMYVILSGIVNPQILNTIFDPTVLFFAIVMLPEPMTSPNNHTFQVVYGGIVAFVTIVISFYAFVPDPLLSALLIGNLAFFKKK